MPAWAFIVVVVAVLVIAAVAFVAARQQRRRRLQETFGPEYDRTVELRGGRRQAESDLEGRARRRRKLDIRPLSESSRERYIVAWREVQARFVDAPAEAVQGADRLVQEAMGERGYPMGDFEQRSADVSVDHPDVVENFRAAHRLAGESGAGRAGTEDLRQAMVHYRALFTELLRDGEGTAERAGDRADRAAERAPQGTR